MRSSVVRMNPHRHVAFHDTPIGRLNSTQCSARVKRARLWAAGVCRAGQESRAAHLMMLRHLKTPDFRFEDVDEAFDGSARAGPSIAALGRAITVTEAAALTVQGGLTIAHASSGALAQFTENGSELRVVYAVGSMATVVPAEQRPLALSARFPLVDAVRLRRELWIANAAELNQQYPELAPEWGAQSWAVLPLIIDDVVLGAVRWSFPFSRPEHGFSARERACLRELVEAASFALHRATLYETERKARAIAEIAQCETLVRLEAVTRERDQIIAEQRLWHAQGKLVEQRELLAQVGRILDSTPDINLALRRVAARSTPLLGDWSQLQLSDAHNRVHLDAKPVVVTPLLVTSKPRRGVGVRALRSLYHKGLRSVMFVPLRFRGRTLGSLTIGSADPARRYDGADVELAIEIGRRCAMSAEYSRQCNAARRAPQTQEDFVAATSHELRRPLSHIKGFISTLRTPATVWDAKSRDDFLAEIEHEADRLTNLVESLLDLSRTDSGGLDRENWSATAPVALIAAGIDRVRGSLGEHTVEIQVADDVPLVWVNASEVERVLANLLENAAKYSPPSAPIGVVARSLGDTVNLRVEDRGLGIPADHIERIFEPFFREPTGGYPAKPGTGLGLAICRSIIRAQDGQIWAEQRPGGGAAFVFTLPIAQAEAIGGKCTR
jgi:signal transduction histidine kinase